MLFNVGSLTLASLTAVAIFDLAVLLPVQKVALAAAGILAGALYFT